MSHYYSEEEASYSFGQNPSFQSFEYGHQDYGQQQQAAQYAYGGDPYMAQAPVHQFEDEPPLLEELGINLDHIVQKTKAVLNPFRGTDATILQDTDLAGPLIFCLAFGSFLLLSGKVHFGYIYGIGVMGCLGMYFLLNMMSVPGVSIGVTISVLGYCLLPMVGLAGISAFVSLKGFLGVVGTFLSIFWCAMSASKLFVTALGMEHQQPLIGYPCALLYGIFALLTVF